MPPNPEQMVPDSVLFGQPMGTDSRTLGMMRFRLHAQNSQTNATRRAVPKRNAYRWDDPGRCCMRVVNRCTEDDRANDPALASVGDAAEMDVLSEVSVSECSNAGFMTPRPTFNRSTWTSLQRPSVHSLSGVARESFQTCDSTMTTGSTGGHDWRPIRRLASFQGQVSTSKLDSPPNAAGPEPPAGAAPGLAVGDDDYDNMMLESAFELPAAKRLLRSVRPKESARPATSQAGPSSTGESQPDSSPYQSTAESSSRYGSFCSAKEVDPSASLHSASPTQSPHAASFTGGKRLLRELDATDAARPGSGGVPRRAEAAPLARPGMLPDVVSRWSQKSAEVIRMDWWQDKGPAPAADPAPEAATLMPHDRPQPESPCWPRADEPQDATPKHKNRGGAMSWKLPALTARASRRPSQDSERPALLASRRPSQDSHRRPSQDSQRPATPTSPASQSNSPMVHAPRCQTLTHFEQAAKAPQAPPKGGSASATPHPPAATVSAFGLGRPLGSARVRQVVQKYIGDKHGS